MARRRGEGAMRRQTAFLTGLAVVLLAGTLAAQEPAEKQEEGRPEPTHRIKVLENPYDISSFYRSSQGRGFFWEYGGDASGLGNPYEDPYSIAGYYRSRQRPNPYGYSMFWTNGYSRGSGPRVGMTFRRRIGQNGDLFLFVPTLLAPVGPLTEVFLGDR